MEGWLCKRFAKKWRCSQAIIKSWEAEGAPLTAPDRDMRAWLKTRQSVPAGTKLLLDRYIRNNPNAPPVSSRRLRGSRRSSPKPSSVPSVQPTNGHIRGAAAALHRLELSEIQSYEELQTLLADPDATTRDVEDARTSWLKTSEALRKYDLAVESARRDSGMLVPREVLESVAKGLVVNMVGPIQAALDALAPRLAGLPSAVEVWKVLSPAYKRAVQSALKAVATHPYEGHMAPDWLVKAVQDAISANLDVTQAVTDQVLGVTGLPVRGEAEPSLPP